MPLLVRRRRDGIVQIRRPRARDVVATPATAALLTMLLAFLAFTAAFVATLVEAPLLLVVAGAFVALGAWGGMLARASAPQPAPADPPGPRAA
jgi:hypothetical protein